MRKASIVVGSLRPRERTVGLVRSARGTARSRSPSTSSMRLPKRSRRCSNSLRACSTRRSTCFSTCARVSSTCSRTSSLPHADSATTSTAASEREAHGGCLPLQDTRETGRMRAWPRATISRVSAGGGSRDHSDANSAPNTSTLAAANTNTSSAISAPSEP